MTEDLRGLLDRKLMTVGGGVVTAGSLLVGAAAILLAILVGNLLALSARRLLHARESPQGVQFAVAKMIRYSVIAVGALVGVNAMGLRLDALLAASAVLAVGIGFGLQNIAQNFISGLILLIEQPVRHGDFIKVGGTLGTVDDIGLRATHIVTRDEVTIIVPNSALISGEVVNHSRPTTNLRIRIAVGVAYGSDMARVKAALLRVADEDPNILKSPAPEVRFEDFGESSLNLALFCWIAHPREDLRVGSALRFSIDAAFRRDGITIPFPQRDVHVHPRAGGLG